MTYLKVITYFLLCILYVWGAVGVVEGTLSPTTSGFLVEELEMDESSSLIAEYLNPANEAPISVRAESGNVFVFQIGDEYVDSNEDLEVVDQFFVDLSLKSGEVAKLHKADSSVKVTVKAPRPIEVTINYRFWSGVHLAPLLAFMELILLLFLSLGYWSIVI